MTTVDVVYRYGATPSEQSALALGAMREVYGIRQVNLQEQARTVTVEYDSSRLSESMIHQFLRRAGVDIKERVERFVVPLPVQPAV